MRNLRTIEMTQRLNSLLRLPAEIRNIIYTKFSSEPVVTIEDLHPEEYNADKRAVRSMRTFYKTKDHAKQSCCYMGAGSTRSILRERRTLALLSLYRQRSAEAVPIFYGCKTFEFNSWAQVFSDLSIAKP